MNENGTCYGSHYAPQFKPKRILKQCRIQLSYTRMYITLADLQCVVHAQEEEWNLEVLEREELKGPVEKGDRSFFIKFKIFCQTYD